jgi:hypothetical protein
MSPFFKVPPYGGLSLNGVLPPLLSSSARSQPFHQSEASFSWESLYGLKARHFFSSKACRPSAYASILFRWALTLGFLFISAITLDVHTAIFHFSIQPGLVPAIQPNGRKFPAAPSIRVQAAALAIQKGSLTLGIYSLFFHGINSRRHPYSTIKPG